MNKPIPKLVGEDYTKHSLSDLLPGHGPAYDLNIAVFNELQHTINGWPCGGPDGDVMLARTQQILRDEAPDLHEKCNRHRQAIAAASLPRLRSDT